MTPKRKQSSPEAQRERILSALARIAAEKGYAAATIYDIASEAGVSKRTFYRHFKDKEACYRGVVDSFREEAEAAIGEAFSAGKEWSEGLRDAVAALLEMMAERPDFAKMAFLEGVAAGISAGERSAGEEVLASLLQRGKEAAPGRPAVPAAAGRAALGGAQALVVDQMIAERTERMDELLPEMVYIVLLPYLGQEEAVRQSRLAEKSRAA
jgi:AcrR family transcriptional regulator